MSEHAIHRGADARRRRRLGPDRAATQRVAGLRGIRVAPRCAGLFGGSDTPEQLGAARRVPGAAKTGDALRRGSPRERGSVLIVAMIVVFALASLVLALGRSVRAEALASANALAQRQASGVARGAEQFVLAVLAEGDDSLAAMDEGRFVEVPVGGGCFWIVRPDYGDPSLPAYGLVDESAKVDLNRAGLDALQLLPGVAAELAGAIVDWRDADDDVSPAGAESPTYLASPAAYRSKNGPFETVEETLLLRGMTRELLYGQGTGLALGGSGFRSGSPAAGDFSQTRGVFDLFTVWSGSTNRRATGERRIHLNRPQERPQLRQLLIDRFGADRGAAVGALIPQRDVIDVFDFAETLRLETAELELIEGDLTVVNGSTVPGLLNVNAAPREAMQALAAPPSRLRSGDVDQLIAARPAPGASHSGSIAWVRDALRERSIGLGRMITGRGAFRSADIVAVSGNGRAFKRVRIVVDTTQSPGRIVYRRDLTDQGWPLDPAILDELRAGAAPGSRDRANRVLAAATR